MAGEKKIKIMQKLWIESNEKKYTRILTQAQDSKVKRIGENWRKYKKTDMISED